MNQGQQSKDDKGAQGMQVGMIGMMAMMMICCMGIFLLVAIIPVIGWPAGIVVAIGGGALLMFGHQKLMNHGSHH